MAVICLNSSRLVFPLVMAAAAAVAKRYWKPVCGSIADSTHLRRAHKHYTFLASRSIADCSMRSDCPTSLVPQALAGDEPAAAKAVHAH